MLFKGVASSSQCQSILLLKLVFIFIQWQCFWLVEVLRRSANHRAAVCWCWPWVSIITSGVWHWLFQLHIIDHGWRKVQEVPNITYRYMQGWRNLMPDLSDLVSFHSGHSEQVRNFYFLCLGTSINKVNAFLYLILWLLIIMSSHLALKTVWILFSWLHQKPADLDLHCLQEKPADQDPYCKQELISGCILFLKEYIVLST